jgi:gamma-glutamylcyclotransferase (GGCT)/AIG2-like uncharacterized protein YtfP
MSTRYGTSVDQRLAVYGSLAPGAVNHEVVEPIGGRWVPGTVTGRLVHDGWGAALGFPAFYPDRSGQPIPVQLLIADDLPAHLPRLDAFEGDDYARMIVPATVDGVLIDVWIYALKQSKGEP